MRIRNPPKLNLKTILPHRRESEDEYSDAFALKRGGIVIGMRREGAKERIYYVGEDSHLLCIGATRSGKSRCLVVESICTLGLAGESIMCSDPKGELYHYTSAFLEKLGYEVLCLDFKSPPKSQRYNLLQPIIDAVNSGDNDRAEMLAWDLTNNLVGKPTGEKIWTNGECSIIAAAILCVVCEKKNSNEMQNMTNVYWFIQKCARQSEINADFGICKKTVGKPPGKACVYFRFAPSNVQGQLLHPRFGQRFACSLTLDLFQLRHKSDFAWTIWARKSRRFS